MRALVLVVLLLALGGPAVATEGGPPLRVLFIGNSATYVNNLPHLVTALAAAQNRRVEARMYGQIWR